MKLRYAFIFLFLLSYQNIARSYGIGMTSHSLDKKTKLLTAELTGITTDDGGLGIQGRYTHKINNDFMADAGVGLGGGDRSLRIFAGMDYEIFPDYIKQPRFSVKGIVERAKEYESTWTLLMLAPTVSKGFSVSGHAVYPFVSLPIGLGLFSEDQRYRSVVSLKTGVTGRLPFETEKAIYGNIEASFNIDNDYTGVFAGVTYPL